MERGERTGKLGQTPGPCESLGFILNETGTHWSVSRSLTYLSKTAFPLLDEGWTKGRLEGSKEDPLGDK